MSVIATALLLATTPATFQSTEALDQILALFTGKAVGEAGGARTPVDSRLKLADCAAPQLAWMSDAQDAIVVRCLAPQWKIYVPIEPGLPRPVVASVAAVPVKPAKVDPVIRRGDPVTIEAGSAGFSITREGIAMGDAAPGGRFLVRVDEKKPPIQAVALESGRATLPGWSR